MKFWRLLIGCAVVMLMAGTAIADEMATGDWYYYIGPPLNAAAGAYDPINDDPAATDWNPSFIAGTPPAGTIPAGQVLVLAQRNLQAYRVKYVSVNVQYTSATPLVTYDRIGHGSRSYTTTHAVMSETDTPGTPRFYMLGIRIMPQPDWEWVELKATSAVPINFTRATISSVCMPVPSTTHIGLIVLVVLLGTAAVWVLWRRRAHATV